VEIKDDDIRAFLSGYVDRAAEERMVANLGAEQAKKINKAIGKTELTDEERSWLKRLVERKRALSAPTLGLPSVSIVVIDSADKYKPLEKFMARAVQASGVNVSPELLCHALIRLMHYDGVVVDRRS